MNNKPNKRELETNTRFWHRSALENLETAKAMLQSKRYNFAMFMCQQTIEAILKCAYVKLKNDRPPYIHKLPRLLTLTGFEAPPWVDKTILRVDAHYIKARYFEDRFNHHIYNFKNALELINQTERALKWFIRELGLEK